MPGTLENDEEIQFDGPAVNARDQSGSELYFNGPGIANTYRIVEGVCVLPVAEAPPEDPGELETWSPVAVMRLHSPYRIRRAAVSVTKQARPPVLPAPGSEGKFKFLGGSLSFANVATGNASDWMCGTEYVYVEDNVSRTVDGYVLGTAPFLYPSQAQAELSTGSPTISSPGAISEAGGDAKRGFSEQSNGPDNYTTMSFFPGLFFNSEIMNGGLGSSPQQFSTLTGGQA